LDQELGCSGFALRGERRGHQRERNLARGELHVVRHRHRLDRELEPDATDPYQLAAAHDARRLR
jgi:hypothetical protein